MLDTDTSITSVKTLLIHLSRETHVILTPNPQGHPLPVSPQPILRRAAYVSSQGDIEANSQHAQSALDNNGILLAFISEDSPTAIVTSRIFSFREIKQVTIADNLRNRPVHIYTSLQRGADPVWWSDYRRGHAGYFLTGTSQTNNLWKIMRLEIDAFDEIILTLRAVNPLGSLPPLRLEGIPTELVSKEIAEQYAELQSSVLAHSYRAVATLTRNITETVMGFVVASKLGRKPGRDLADHLRIIKEIREASRSELEAVPDLCYHLAHKIRLIHARTHIDRTEVAGRSVEPELALSCIEDLKEILRMADLQ